VSDTLLRMSYAPEWIPAGWVVLVAFLCAPPLVMIALGVLLLTVMATFVALAGATVATPYLLFRSVRRRTRRKRKPLQRNTRERLVDVCSR
jgi:membrane protein implicated in regulation of membrane protease activity